MSDIEISLRYIGNGKFQAVTSIEAEWCEHNFKEDSLSVFKVIKWTEKRGRTKLQNNALHLWCTKLANALNDAGLDMRAVLKPDHFIPWSMLSVKENLFKTVMKAVYPGKESTAKLDTKEITKVAQIVDKKMLELGINEQWPDRFNQGLEG